MILSRKNTLFNTSITAQEIGRFFLMFQIRFNKHIAKLKINGVLATSEDLLRAGKMGSHGEIRALDKLLKEVDPQGKLGKAVFQGIVGYNRFLWNVEKIQPPCVHCYCLTAGVKFIGF